MRRLLIRPGAIGDCILSFPALASLRASYTEVWISSPVVPLVDFANRVCSISSTGLDLLGLPDRSIDTALQQRLSGFDEIVSWYGVNRPEFRTALESLGPPCRFYPALPPPNAPVHAIDFFCQQVGAPAGAIPVIRVEQTSPPRSSVVIHPFSGSLRKNWPLACFEQLAPKIPLSVEWLAGPDEMLEGAHRCDDLKKLAQWLAGTRLFVGNDSGITHLAAALGIPTIALFRSTSPDVWAPRGAHVQAIYDPDLQLEQLLPIVLAAVNR